MEIIIETTQPIDGNWLLLKLTVAGITNSGVTPNVNNLTLHGINPAQEQAARNVVAAYDQNEFAQFEARLFARWSSAMTNAKNVPSWSAWSEADALDWWNANLSDTQTDAIANLTDAKAILKKQNAALKAMARMLIAMRDRLWPTLPEG
jgi:hypothetical protein